MSYEWYDLVGNLGVLLILSAYFLLQTQRIQAQNPAFSLANAVGAACILLSLYFDFNLSAAIIESAWLLISIMGLAQYLKQRR